MAAQDHRRRLRRAQLVDVRLDLTALDGRPGWVATDTAKRRFIAPTKEEAVKMLEDYNR